MNRQHSWLFCEQILPLKEILLFTMLRTWIDGNILWSSFDNAVELQWLEHFRNHGNMFEIGIARANEC